MYYQFDRYGRYLTLTQEDYKAITEWVKEYFVGGSAPFPLSGAIPAADYKFVIDYNTDVEFVDNRDLKAPGEMAKYRCVWGSKDRRYPYNETACRDGVHR